MTAATSLRRNNYKNMPLFTVAEIDKAAISKKKGVVIKPNKTITKENKKNENKVNEAADKNKKENKKKDQNINIDNTSIVEIKKPKEKEKSESIKIKEEQKKQSLQQDINNLKLSMASNKKNITNLEEKIHLMDSKIKKQQQVLTETVKMLKSCIVAFDNRVNKSIFTDASVKQILQTYRKLLDE